MKISIQLSARIASIALLVAAAAACGGDDSGSDTTTATTAVAATSSSGAAPTTTAGGDATAPTSTAPTTSAPADDAVTGGTLTLNAPATSNMWPYRIFGPIATTGSRERFAVYDALAVMSTDGEVQYRIAESMESIDGTTWTIRLRPGVMFSDGTPFNAEAIRYNWAKMVDPATGSSQAAIAATVTASTAVDDTTLEVTLAAPNMQFPSLVATSALAFIGSPTAMDQLGEGFNTKPVGAGPYLLDEWVDGSFMRLVRNPDYYGDAPYLDEIEFQYIEDPTGGAQYNTLQTGDLDILTGASPDVLAQATDAGYEVIDNPTNGGSMFQMNTAAPPFDDIRARQAVALAFNFEEMNASAFGGHADPADTLFVEGAPLFSDIPLLPAADADAAQALFDELAAEGKPLDFKITLFADVDQFDDWLIAQLSSFDNVSVTAEVIGRPAALQAYREGNFQATLRPLQFISPEPLLSDNYSSTGAQNYGKYSNPAVDAALETARTSEDEAARKAAYEVVQEALATDVPSFFYRRLGNSLVLQSADTFGDLPLLSDGLIDFARAWKQ